MGYPDCLKTKHDAGIFNVLKAKLNKRVTKIERPDTSVFATVKAGGPTAGQLPTLLPNATDWSR